MDYAKVLNQDFLMTYARDPSGGLTQAFTGMILAATRSGILPYDLPIGLSRERFILLLDCYFPGAWEAMFEAYDKPEGGPVCLGLRMEEIDDLLMLLLENCSNGDEHTIWLAYAIAAGCLGDNHLYQDMGLPNRQALSDLLRQNFTALYEKNSGNMKWKKFFYKQLCERAEVNLCKAPSCSVCNDYHVCFGPEEG